MTSALFGLAFLFVVCSAGYATLRALRLQQGLLRLGLVAPAGLAILCVLSTWAVALRAPPPAPGLLVLGLAAFGAWRARSALGARLRCTATFTARSDPTVVLLLAAATIAPLAIQAFAFHGAQVPLSPHDGAYHAQAIDAHRSGRAWSDWYPPGMAALFAAILQSTPWLDTAHGAFLVGASLSPLASLGAFGLGLALWRGERAAAASALLLSLTYLYPYFPQLWSGWPLAMSLVMITGLWAVGLEYLACQSLRLALLAGLLVGAIVLTHGSELYTLALILPLLLLGAARVDWRALLGHAVMAAAVAVICAAPYLPTLINWAGGGGAYAVGLEDAVGVAKQAGSLATPDRLPLVAVYALDALGVDLPLRLGLVAAGVTWAVRRRMGRAVVVVGTVFAGLAVTFASARSSPLVAQLYAATFPWGMHYRLLMIVALAQAVLAGMGAVAIWRALAPRLSSEAVGRRVGRAVRLLVLTWLGLVVWSMPLFVEYPSRLVLGYGPDDDLAMAWLRQNAPPGAVLANDGFADAGIWAPYKAGVETLYPRIVAERGRTGARARA
ncbi:MAG: hypothetical protein M3336_06295 [Chloroflexota bacterium]|nr:hypothetical protein [Chloroflexota bacterium]